MFTFFAGPFQIKSLIFPLVIIAAIATVVTVAEILKNNGLAIEKRILTSTVEMKDETREWPIQKSKVEIILTKADKFDELMAAASEEREFGGGEDVHR